MDELVRQALARWPNVPDCSGWLALDARGRWRIGEAEGGPRQTISHAATIAYINRNYARHGRCWIFQNGPQRVFVDLEYTPFVWRLVPREDGRGWTFVAHTGQAVVPTSLWLDDDGRFLASARVDQAPETVGVIHDHDTALVAEALRDERGDAIDDDRLADLALPQSPASAAATASATAATTPTAITFDWTTNDGDVVSLPLQRIAANQVPVRFGFEPRPSVALRVDVDTRR